MKNKINLRLAGIAILAVLSTLLAITLVYYGLFQRQIRNDLAVSAKLLKDTHYFESADINPANIDLSTSTSELRVTWIAGDGTVLYDNDASASGLANHLDRPEIIDAFNNGVGEIVRQSDTMKQNTFYYAILLDNGTVLRVATNAQSLPAIFMNVAPVVALLILLIMAICIALSHLLTRQLIKPIEEMADNLSDSDLQSPYRELDPFAEKLRLQHADVLSAAKARQDFTANVSHELKTPLTAIVGYAELLEGDMVLEDKKHHLYEEIEKNAKRLLSLINDIIRLSELDKERSPIFEEINLAEIAKDAVNMLEVNAKQRNIELTLEATQTYIHGNREMMRELIENLVQNAIRYNNPGGKVEVIINDNDGPKLIVKDNGIGIPDADQKRVFERFYRVDKSRSKATGGTGLGLAIVKHIVDLHDARITLDSKLNVGTTMTVYF